METIYIITKHLIVIEKPQITETQKSILHKSFALQCIIFKNTDTLTYKWKLNGTYLDLTSRAYSGTSELQFTNLTKMDKWSKLICQVKLENCGYMKCKNCTLDSETYTIEPYYGPHTVFLSLNKSDIYLEENGYLKVKCSADCYPLCTYRWESYYINTNNEELVINSFSSRLAGPYTCFASNGETGVTAKSYPIFLHQAGVFVNHGHKEDSSLQYLSVGLVIIPVSLIIVAVSALAMNRRKHASRRLDQRVVITGSRRTHEPREGPSNRVVQEFLNFKREERPLPIAPVQENSYRRTRRPANHNGRIKSRSLQTLLNHTQDFCNPVRKSLSLQTFLQLSHTTGRRSKIDESPSKMCWSKKDSWPSMEGPTDGAQLKELYSNFGKDEKDSNAKQNSTRSISLNNPHFGRLDPGPQEDLYNTIDEAAFSGYDYARSSEHEESVHDDRRNVEAGNYDYDYATWPPLQ